MRTNRVLIIILVALLALPLVGMVGFSAVDDVAASVRMNSENFDRDKWMAAADGADKCARWRMWGDLNRNYLRSGTPRARAVELLGDPEFSGPISNIGRGFSIRGLRADTICSHYDLGACSSFYSSGDKALLCWDDEDMLIKTAVWEWG